MKLVLYFYSIFPYIFKVRLSPFNIVYFSHSVLQLQSLKNEIGVTPNNDTRIKGPKTPLVTDPT